MHASQENTELQCADLDRGMRLFWGDGAAVSAVETPAGAKALLFLVGEGEAGWMACLGSGTKGTMGTGGFGVRVDLPANWLASLLPEGAQTSRALPLPAPARLAAESIRRCAFTGPCRSLILGARCNDLVVSYVSAQVAGVAVSPRPMFDVDARVRAAAATLSRDLERTVSIAELAREFGLSETTLKRGFRSVFGTSVIGFQRTRRMEWARQQLEAGRATVMEAAVQVGYSNPSNFASAFRKEFGVNPKEFQLAARRTV